MRRLLTLEEVYGLSARELTPMMKQYLEIKENYKDCILLFRLGDFYEAFFEDARKVSEALQIVLTSRNGNPMAGVPHHAVDQYVKKLLDAGYKVAICEQVEDPATAKGLVKREVTRVLTPGTLMEDDLLPSETNNYISILGEYKGRLALAISDISTGEVGTSTVMLEDAKDLLEKFRPSQLILQESLVEHKDYLTSGMSNLFVEVFENWNFAHSSSVEYVKRFYGLASLDVLELSETEVTVLGALFKYLEITQFKTFKHLSLPVKLQAPEYMLLDAATIENLSLLPSEKRGSLFETLKETATAMGARLLKKWILTPLTTRPEIEKRLDYVEAFVQDRLLHEEFREFLRRVFDIERIAARLSSGKAVPRDLQSLRSTLQILPYIKELFETNSVFLQIAEEIPDFSYERNLLETALEDEPSASPGDGNVIRAGYNREFDELRELLYSSKEKLQEFEQKEKSRTGINSLKVKYNKVFGYFIEVPKTQLAKIPDDYIRKQTLVNSERFITPELKGFEDKLLSASERIEVMERELFSEICQKLNDSADEFKRVAKILSAADVYQSFATVARKYGYTRPRFSEKRYLLLKNSRHPMVERYIRDFVPNSVVFDEERIFYILTGPNMSGKSTFIRQVALCAIMAQIGSFVPAAEAVLPIYDRVFTRIGARDDVAGGKSTFLVEMMETASILSKATEDSLVVLDEVGRGTSTFDGISIAWAVSEFIYEAIGCHTVFATHFTELTELASMYKGIKNITVAVEETDKGIIFLHKVIEGVAERSHGIEVAKLAGIPQVVLDRAKEILGVIVKSSALDKTVKVLTSEEITKIRKTKKGKMHRNQLSLFEGS
ncbi:DNA mismatch repair protein MutS [Kosmotoga pacifica]|uniref:DNA mismatch repair protein MutS n=1 Tax=Kosmotoga pacifica TaxID=1330330 RepID=A0A0G2Z9F7_9BACT|nr:DNA mismatch repair protein MutS [Kosmotoga pacifica]